MKIIRVEIPMIYMKVRGLLLVLIMRLQYIHKRTNALINVTEIDFFINPSAIASIPAAFTENVENIIILKVFRIKGKVMVSDTIGWIDSVMIKIIIGISVQISIEIDTSETIIKTFIINIFLRLTG